MAIRFFVIVATLFVTSCDRVFPYGQQSTEAGTIDAAAQCNAGWTLRRRVLLRPRTLTENLTDFPIGLVLDLSEFSPTALAANGTDLRFVDGATRRMLSHEIESWDVSNQQAHVWVRLQTLAAAPAETTLWLEYGNPRSVPAPAPVEVWANGFIGVWHLHFPPKAAINQAQDSSRSQVHGVPQNLAAADIVPGVFASALSFNGSTQAIRIPSNSQDVIGLSRKELTVEGWVNTLGCPLDACVLVGRQFGTGSGDSYALFLRTVAPAYAPDVVAGVVSVTFGKFFDTESANPLPVGRWVHLAGVIRPPVVTLYVAGQMAGQVPVPANEIPIDDNDVVIGAEENGADDSLSEFLPGKLDEVRVSNVARSATWLRTHVENLTQSFVTIGPEERCQ